MRLSCSVLACVLLLPPSLARSAPVDDLYDAVERSDLSAIERALEQGGDPVGEHIESRRPGFIRRFFGMSGRISYDTPLHRAVELAFAQGGDELAVLDALLAVHPSLMATTSDRPTPLSLAVVQVRDHGTGVVVLDRLLAAGASPGSGVLMLAVERPDEVWGPGETAVLDRLLGAGAGPGDALCVAAEVGDGALTKALLERGAPLEHPCGTGSPLAVAVAAAKIVVVQSLVAAGADLGALATEGRTLFEWPSPEIDAVLLAAPSTPRKEAALLAAWAVGSVSDDQVAAIPAARLGAWAFKGWRVNGADGIIDAYSDVGGDRFLELFLGPLASPPEYPCEFIGGSRPRNVRRHLGPVERTERQGPITVLIAANGRAGFLRDRGRRLVWVEPPPACDPFGGQLIGVPRSVVRLALHPPEHTWRNADGWPATGVASWGERRPRFVVDYDQGLVRTVRLDWRHW